MNPDARCFRCHVAGHLAADCPNRTRRAKAHPPAPPLMGGPDDGREADVVSLASRRVPPRRDAGQIADTHAWAERIRASLGADSQCDDLADLYTSEYRRWARLGAIHLCKLRQLARRQADETAAARQP